MPAPLIVASGRSPSIAYVIEPRFSGGTSAAIAAELKNVAPLGKVTVHCRTSAMFGSVQRIAPVLFEELDRLGLSPIWDAPEILADLVIVHNPAFLKLQRDFGARIFARHLVVVTHENFLRPGGVEGFDVGSSLNAIDRAALALRKSIAPISPHNRATVTGWLAEHAGYSNWDLLDADWINVCDMPRTAPNDRPKDRRGRHSRPQMEKFPPLAELDACFSEQAEANVILGADTLIGMEVVRPHWTMLPFRSIEVSDYFEMMDFLVYFTAPTWRESFGRVIAESLAAGKVVLTDPDTATTFGDGVVPCRPAEVDRIVARFVAQPELYVSQALAGQRVLDQYSASVFRDRFCAVLAAEPRWSA